MAWARSAGSTGLARWYWKPACEGALAVLVAGVGGEGDGGDGAAFLGGAAAELADEPVAVLVGHGDVADEDVGDAALGAHGVEGVAGGAGGGDDGAAALEDGGDHLAGVGLVVDEQHAHAVEVDRLDRRRAERRTWRRAVGRGGAAAAPAGWPRRRRRGRRARRRR